MATAYGSGLSTVIDGLYITEVEVQHRWDRISSSPFADEPFKSPIVGQYTEIVIHGVVGNPEILQLFWRPQGTPLTAMKLREEEEFFCIYCNSVNPLSNRFCSQCGAPRGFLIGQNP